MPQGFSSIVESVPEPETPLSRIPCYIVATRAEADPLFRRTRLVRRWSLGPSSYWWGEDHQLLITGIGPVAAAAACAWLAGQSHTRWLNLGIAGNLRTHAPGSIHHVVRVSGDGFEHPTDRRQNQVRLESGDGDISLISVGAAVHDLQRRELLGRSADLVDMEGFSIASVAGWSGIGLRMLKIVSDDADGQGDILRQLPRLMTQLWSVVLDASPADYDH